jgi:hypothetical protein
LPVEGLSLNFVLHARVLGIGPKFLQPKLNPNTETRCMHSGYESGAAEQGAHANA